MLTNLFLKLTYVGAEWVMWILLLLSIVSIALMVERWLFFFRTKVDGDELGPVLRQLVIEEGLDLPQHLVAINP